MTTSLLMLGQFSPPITGEYEINKACKEFFSSSKIEVEAIDTCIISDASQVGRLQLSKFIRAFLLFFKFFKKVLRFEVIYLTPGQTFFGMMRFAPFILMSIIFKKKIFCHWHGYGILPLVSRYGILRALYFSHCVESIVLTEDLHNRLREHVGDSAKIHVVRNFSALPLSEATINKGRMQVLYLSSLITEKGIEDFLCAASDPRLTAMDFHICGDGSATMLAVVHQYTKQNNIYFHGLVSGNEKLRKFLASDVFVLPTYYPTEGVPLSILEALSSGCAIISTAHNGIPETLGNAGIFVSSQSPLEIVEALIRLNADRDLLFHYKNLSINQAKGFRRDTFFSSLSGVLGFSKQGYK